MFAHRRLIAVAVGATLVLAPISPAVANSEVVASNLLQNPGFESDLTGWTGGSGSIVTSPAYSGSKARQINARSSAAQTTTQTVAVTGGTAYQASGWIKVANIEEGAKIQVQWRNGSGSLLRIYTVGTMLTDTADWTQRSASLIAPAGATHARFVLRVEAEADNSGQAWFDDVSFGPSGSGTPDYVIEGLATNPETLTTGQLATFSAIVRNAGNGAASVSSTARLRIDVNNDGMFDVTPANQTAAALSAGSTETETWSDVWTATAGTHWVEVCADVGSAIAESNEANNCTTMTFIVAASSIEDTLLSPPCSGVQLTPSDDIQRKLDSRPEGTTFCLAPGTYRITSTLVLKARQKLIGTGTRAAVMSGARVVQAARQGDRWVITGQRSLGESTFSGTSSQCRPVNGVDPKGMCVFKDQVFLDDVSLWQVGSLSELSAGEFYWDYSTSKIYLADDPSGHALEVSLIGTRAIQGNAGVVINNVVVEKFGNSVQSGAIAASRDWTITDSEIRLNHGGGVHMGPGTVLRRNYIHHNGQIGIHGGQARCAAATGLIVEDNEIAFNNAAGYNWGHEGGATKWTHTDGLIVRRNYVHDNYGMGLWTDGANINVLYEDNVVEDNHGMGIDHERGFAAIIRNNAVRRNGFAHPIQGAAWGAGIFIDQSRDVEVYGNVVEDNAAGITAVQEPAGATCTYPEAEVTNLYVHDNTVRQPEGIAAGLQLFRESDQSYYLTKNNHWEDNTYSLGDAEVGLHFRWSSGAITAEAWRSYGNDANGSFEPDG